jgi:hypothetical protein
MADGESRAILLPRTQNAASNVRDGTLTHFDERFRGKPTPESGKRPEGTADAADAIYSE